MLSTYLKHNSCIVLQSADETNTMIANEVISKTKIKTDVIVVEKDIDFIVLLIAFYPEEKNYYFFKT